MDQNPYQSPQAIEHRPLVPGWRRAASLPFIVFGYVLAFAGVPGLLIGVHSLSLVPIYLSVCLIAIGLASVRFGFKLRHPSPADLTDP